MSDAWKLADRIEEASHFRLYFLDGHVQYDVTQAECDLIVKALRTPTLTQPQAAPET